MFFFSISGIKNEDVDSFICELKDGNDIKRRQSISLQGTDTIHHTEIVIFLIKNENACVLFFRKF